MEIEFADGQLERVEADPTYSAGLSQALVKLFRKRMQQMRAAVDERDLRALKSLHFEKLSGARRHQHSMRLNDQYRLIVELQGEASPKIIRIIGIEDYH
jgi:proteic killer suppression protein